jgi:GT2 family glycosyltransferase
MASIIIVSFNTKELTRNCLTSLQQHEPNMHVIVVDNASHDGSAEMISREFPDVKLVTLTDNVGFGGANNVGYQHVVDDIVILLNSDTILNNNALSQCVQRLNDNPKLGVVSPALRGVDGQPQQCRHRFPTVSDHVRKALRKQPNSVADVPEDWCWLAGTCLVLKKEAIEQAGGLFDHNLFMYWEDADLSSRLLAAGWKLAECKDIEIIHYGGASGGGPDSVRRPDLHAWYTYGRHHWFAKHRPIWERFSLWTLEVLDTFRCLVRGVVRPDRRTEWVHAGTMFRVLIGRLFGQKPAPIGK